eukprot:CAMPEP_0179102692 /NCGR_PEP_ID=MMETSP0796-20121207/47543_1 /TAXON_ID=73915 /ORGANISM="Pyrodinium bahamense, Strain pbaha01" /LENGTH=286 /DNA_ID=CAMNT_0020800575 /DNA_START=82 /DNA_END=942 /DNA_ORIENTATION=-
MAQALQLAFMRCIGCGIEFDEIGNSETVGGPELGETVIDCPGSHLSGGDGPWWTEPTATFEFEQVPSQFARSPAEPDAAGQTKHSLPALGPRLALPPRLPLPLVEEEKAHWPLEEAEEAAARQRPPEQLQPAPRGPPAEARDAEHSPNPCKELPASSTVSTRSASSRFPSSSSGSMRSGGGLEEERRPIVCPAIKWRINVDKNESMASVGLDLVDLPATKDREGALKINQVEAAGIISEWNKSHKNKEVKKGDYIVEVNGFHGGPEELRDVLARDAFLDIMMLRGT